MILASSDAAGLSAIRSYRRPLPWRYVVVRALVIWLVTRLLDVALTVLFTSGSAAQRLNLWSLWDGRFYEDIARTGYPMLHPRIATFFPLYPLLMHPFLGPDVLERQLAALAVANLGTLAGLIAVGLLAAYEQRAAHASWTPMLLLAASPLGVFLAGAYTDGLFVGLVAWSLLAARRGAWTWAALAAALAMVARPFGVLLVPALLVEYGSQHAWGWGLRTRAFIWPARSTARHLALVILAPAAALGAFMLVLWRHYGDPLAFLHRAGAWRAGYVAWGHGLRWPWATLMLVWRELLTLPHWAC